MLKRSGACIVIVDCVSVVLPVRGSVEVTVTGTVVVTMLATGLTKEDAGVSDFLSPFEAIFEESAALAVAVGEGASGGGRSAGRLNPSARTTSFLFLSKTAKSHFTIKFGMPQSDGVGGIAEAPPIVVFAVSVAFVFVLVTLVSWMFVGEGAALAAAPVGARRGLPSPYLTDPSLATEISPSSSSPPLSILKSSSERITFAWFTAAAGVGVVVADVAVFTASASGDATDAVSFSVLIFS